jgi:hypothetical protein
MISESPFWYYVGHCLWKDATDDIIQSIPPMNKRARDLNIPIEWNASSSIPWAVSCRAYVLSKEYANNADRKTFNAFRSGISASIGPQGFFDHALERIIGNVSSPAFSERLPHDSVADTFALGSMNYLVPEAEAEQIHLQILELVAADPQLHQAALLAVAPDRNLWHRCVSEYRERRPSFFKRVFSNADSWLFK